MFECLFAIHVLHHTHGSEILYKKTALSAVTLILKDAILSHYVMNNNFSYLFSKFMTYTL